MLCEFIDENFKKGFIRHSKSPIGALILFIKNYQKERWFFMNVCQLSWIEYIHHQESIPNWVVGPTKSCQGVQQD